MERGPSANNYLQGNKRRCFRFFAGNSRRRLPQAVFFTPTPKSHSRPWSEKERRRTRTPIQDQFKCFAPDLWAAIAPVAAVLRVDDQQHVQREVGEAPV